MKNSKRLVLFAAVTPNFEVHSGDGRLMNY
jgi:hypothetical protein